jgi:hypothetical protein
MPLRFARRVSLIPGLRVNFSKSGASLSIGHRGAWYTVGPRGRRLSVGLPGTGLYWVEQSPPAPEPHAGHRVAFLAAIAVFVAMVVAAIGVELVEPTLWRPGLRARLIAAPEKRPQI